MISPLAGGVPVVGCNRDFNSVFRPQVSSSLLVEFNKRHPIHDVLSAHDTPQTARRENLAVPSGTVLTFLATQKHRQCWFCWHDNVSGTVSSFGKLACIRCPATSVVHPFFLISSCLPTRLAWLPTARGGCCSWTCLWNMIPDCHILSAQKEDNICKNTALLQDSWPQVAWNWGVGKSKDCHHVLQEATRQALKPAKLCWSLKMLLSLAILLLTEALHCQWGLRLRREGVLGCGGGGVSGPLGHPHHQTPHMCVDENAAGGLEDTWYFTEFAGLALGSILGRFWVDFGSKLTWYWPKIDPKLTPGQFGVNPQSNRGISGDSSQIFEPSPQAARSVPSTRKLKDLTCLCHGNSQERGTATTIVKKSPPLFPNSAFQSLAVEPLGGPCRRNSKRIRAQTIQTSHPNTILWTVAKCSWLVFGECFGS